MATTRYKFRVVRGRHHEDGKTYFKATPQLPSPHGDTFVTTNDLRKHNYPGSKKFDLLQVLEDGAAPDPEPGPVLPPEPWPQVLSEGDLSKLTIAELRAFAEGEEIDLTGLRTRDEILKTIHAALDE